MLTLQRLEPEGISRWTVQYAKVTVAPASERDALARAIHGDGEWGLCAESMDCNGGIAVERAIE
jgi:hypothetical protein